MPRTSEDVENYLLQLERRFENDKGTFLIFGGEADPTVALRVAGPVVALRVDIGPVPEKEPQQAKLFKRLLEFNATDLMHCSYGIEKDEIVLSAALELENLDKNELEAMLSDVDLAVARHIAVLRNLATA